MIALVGIVAVCTGCATDTTPFTTKIAQLEGENEDLNNQVASLESTVKGYEDRQASAEREGLATCMRILFELPPRWKTRLRLDLLDFSAGQDLNAGVMAETDVVAGSINILTGGVTNIWGRRAKLLEEKYGIWVMHLASQDDGEAIFRLINGYNAISKKAIKAKFGQDFLDNIFQPSGKAVDPGAGIVADPPDDGSRL